MKGAVGRRPPRLAVWLVTWGLPAEEREGILGDLEEEYRGRREGAGRSVAARWYWRQAVGIVVGFLPVRWGGRGVGGRPAGGRRWGKGRKWWGSGWGQDIRVAVRGWFRNPGFALAAVLTFALGIGVNAAVFSVVNGVLLKPLPYRAPEGLVAVWPGRFLSNREVEYLRAHDRSYTGVASFSPGWLTALTGIEGPAQVMAARVSGNLFGLLGVRPELGRTFGMEAERPGEDRVVVLGHGAWQQYFGGDPGVVGRRVRLDGELFTVIGVMPPGFQVFNQETDLWYPLTMDPAAFFYRGQVTLGIGRLRPGITPASASRELRQRVVEMRRLFGEPDAYGTDAVVQPLRESMVGDVRSLLLILLGAVGLILLIAGANVGNLLLIRGTARQQEMAVRASLGAGRSRLVRQLVTESVLLALLGAAVGLAAAAAGVHLLRSLLATDVPRLGEVDLAGRVLGVGILLALICGIGFGVAPALSSASVDMRGWSSASRADGGYGRGRRLRNLLVAVETALALVLVVGAGLMVRSIAALRQVNPGFRTEHVLALYVQPSGMADAAARREYWREVFPRLRAVPGVEEVGTVLHLPLGGRSWSAEIAVEGRPLPRGATPPQSAWQAVGGDYFRVLDIPLVHGRWFRASDGSDQPLVVLVNQSFARRLFPGTDPVGRRIRAVNVTPADGWATVVGVVGDVRQDALTAPAGPEIYVPFEQRTVVGINVVLRTAGQPASVLPAVRRAIWEVDPEVPISHAMPLAALLDQSIARPWAVTVLLGLFALLGLALGLVGIYGVVAFSAACRRHEIGIRMAVGAGEPAVTRLVVRQGMRAVLVGLAAGLMGAWMLTRLLRSFLFGVTTTDPATFAVVAAALLGAALLAAYLPARRAARVDPALLLRRE